MKSSQIKQARAALIWSAIAEGDDFEASKLIDQYGYALALEKVLENDENAISKLAIRRWSNRLSIVQHESLEAYLQRGYTIVLRGSEYWPVGLDDLGERRPLSLWVRGNPKILTQKMISIVGSRDASSEGERVALDLAYNLAGEYLIVSGGAFGIDAQAHQGALLANQPTVIVSAAGVDRVYPKQNSDIFEKCVEAGGAIVSESIPGAAPQRFRFLLRNRIIAAMSKAVIVVEAGVRSGALNTARQALEIGREVGAFPGSVFKPQCLGTNQLIRNGATLVMNASQVRELIGVIGTQIADPQMIAVEAGFTMPLVADFDSLTNRVYDSVSKVRFENTELIAKRVGVDMVTAKMKLGRLVLAGKIIEKNGKWRKV